MLSWLSFSAEAQQPAKIPRIGYVSGTGSATDQGPYIEALRQGLRDLGYIEGKNIAIEFRGAKGKNEEIPNLVKELVQDKVNVLWSQYPQQFAQPSRLRGRFQSSS
jgi:putative ABC transport system substrate-binding protein